MENSRWATHCCMGTALQPPHSKLANCGAQNLLSTLQVWVRRVLKSRKAKHGWVGIGAQRSHGKPNGKFVASVVAPGSGAEPRIVLGGGFPTREVRETL